MLGVGGTVVGVDEDVVEVNDAEDVEVLAKGVVHEVLEGCWSVGETEGHDGVLEVAVAAAKGGFPFVSGSDSNEVVRAAQIELGKESSFGKSVEGFGDEREWVTVLESELVEAPIVDAETKGSVLLLDEKDGSSSGRRRVSNESLVEILLDENLQSVELGS